MAEDSKAAVQHKEGLSAALRPLQRGIFLREVPPAAAGHAGEGILLSIYVRANRERPSVRNGARIFFEVHLHQQRRCAALAETRDCDRDQLHIASNEGTVNSPAADYGFNAST